MEPFLFQIQKKIENAQICNEKTKQEKEMIEEESREREWFIYTTERQKP